jgi:hypothetical protein
MYSGASLILSTGDNSATLLINSLHLVSASNMGLLKLRIVSTATPEWNPALTPEGVCIHKELSTCEIIDALCCAVPYLLKSGDVLIPTACWKLLMSIESSEEGCISSPTLPELSEVALGKTEHDLGVYLYYSRPRKHTHWSFV